MTIETRFASSAPADSETMLTIAPSGNGPDGAKNHTSAAAVSCNTATRLVARCTAPICVRSPNLSAVAITFTTNAAKNSHRWWCSGSAGSP